jgi:molybdate transport system substrate-binding protein
MATRHLLAALASRIESASPLRTALESVGGVDAANRVRAGEAVDVVVLASDAIDKLIASGHLRPGSRADIVRSGIAVAVRAGAPHPDIGSGDAVRRAVAAARTVAYSTGPSGAHIAGLFERWGLADALKERIVVPRPGVPVATLVASGEVELGFQQLSELTTVEGVDVVGMLPDDIQSMTTFSGAVAQTSAQPDAARELLRLMRDPSLDAVKREHGMEAA